MKVILTKNLENLGVEGETVKVAPGHARNYLLPRSLAILSTPENEKVYERKRKKLEQQRNKQKQEMQALAEKLNELKIVLQAEAGEEGKLFGSITSMDIAQKIQETSGIEVDRRKIVLEEPIKSLGAYTLPVKLMAEVEATIKVRVENAKDNTDRTSS